MALQVYRRILKVARRFDPATRGDIRAEAATLFRQNASLTDPKEIAAKLFEATSRSLLRVGWCNLEVIEGDLGWSSQSITE